LIIADESWRELLDILKIEDEQKSVYVIGCSDSGKTTFCRYLLENLLGKFLTAYIDCDPGQSVIGPPTTVGMEIYESKVLSDSKQYLMFTGSTSPKGHLLQNLTSIKCLVDFANKSGVQRLVIDSSGFVLGGIAQEFQYNVIQLIKPDFIVAFQREDELEGILKNFNKYRQLKIFRFTVSEHVRQRTSLERQIYREEKFRGYFKVVQENKINIDDYGFHGRIPGPGILKQKNRLFSLNDDIGFVVALGIVKEVDTENKTIIFFSLPFDMEKVSNIQIGDIFLEPSGREIKGE